MSAAREQPALDPADLPGVVLDDRWRLPIVDAAALTAACERDPSLNLAVSVVRDATPYAVASSFGLQARLLVRLRAPPPPLTLSSTAAAATAAAAATSIQHRHRPSYSQLDIVWMSPERLRMASAPDLAAGVAQVVETVRTKGALRHMMLTILRHYRLQACPPALVFSAIFYPAAPPVRLNHIFTLPLVWRAADGRLERCALAARCRRRGSDALLPHRHRHMQRPTRSLTATLHLPNHQNRRMGAGGSSSSYSPARRHLRRRRSRCWRRRSSSI